MEGGDDTPFETGPCAKMPTFTGEREEEEEEEEDDNVGDIDKRRKREMQNGMRGTRRTAGMQMVQRRK